jgi:hypothetical protein
MPDLRTFEEMEIARHARFYKTHPEVTWLMRNMHHLLIYFTVFIFCAVILVVVFIDGSSAEKDKRLRKSRGEITDAAGRHESRKGV